jgi:hypothetical protein
MEGGEREVSAELDKMINKTLALREKLDRGEPVTAEDKAFALEVIETLSQIFKPLYDVVLQAFSAMADAFDAFAESLPDDVRKELDAWIRDNASAREAGVGPLVGPDLEFPTKFADPGLRVAQGGSMTRKIEFFEHDNIGGGLSVEDAEAIRRRYNAGYGRSGR